jgi:hypothetical protein
VRRPGSLPDGFRDAGAYAGGEFGARRVVDDDGRSYVYKEQPPGLAPQTTELLRPLGYPAPRYVAWGDDYCVQEELPGRPAWRGWGMAGTRHLIARLVELNELQEGRAVDDDRSWPRDIAHSVDVGFPEYAVVGTLERHSAASRELLALCRGAVDRNAEAVTACDDIVHWDFTRDNVLVDDGRVTAALTVGRSDDLEHARRLIKERSSPDRAALADLDADLAAI